ncbi:MAG: class I SAM-dependent methyltransferase [Rickettsiales bacterium]
MSDEKERIVVSQKEWEAFYKRHAVLPESGETTNFLEFLPQNANILDFGAGNGRWAAAFARDRPDLMIDIFDQNTEQAFLIPENWKGEKIKGDFADYSVTCIGKQYDGIWSYASLFFMNYKTLYKTFHELALSLKNDGVIWFSMVDKCDISDKARFNGLTEEEICRMLAGENLQKMSIIKHENKKYGKNEIIIPTYYVLARKA